MAQNAPFRRTLTLALGLAAAAVATPSFVFPLAVLLTSPAVASRLTAS